MRGWSLTAAVLVLVGVASFARAAEPGASTPTTQDLFENAVGGHASYRIPGLVVTAKGTLLAYCEARKNGPGDYGEIEQMLRRSTDGGTTWSAPQLIANVGPRIEGNPAKAVGGEHEQTVDNPCAIAGVNGAVHYLYCVNYARAFYRHSDDDGQTFGPPVEITSAFEGFRAKCDWKVIATGPTHGVQLRSGRLVVPVWLAYGATGKHSPSVSATIYSDDDGKTWHTGDIAVPNGGEIANPNECVVAERSDGSVMMNARSVSPANRRIVTTSADGATGWSTPRFVDALWEPICAASFVAVPGHPRTMLFANPRTLPAMAATQPGAKGKRANLSIRVSVNDGETWSAGRTIEAGPSGYSDLAVLSDGTIACFFERGAHLTLARISLAWASADATGEPAAK